MAGARGCLPPTGRPAGGRGGARAGGGTGRERSSLERAARTDPGSVTRGDARVATGAGTRETLYSRTAPLVPVSLTPTGNRHAAHRRGHTSLGAAPETLAGRRLRTRPLARRPARGGACPAQPW